MQYVLYRTESENSVEFSRILNVLNLWRFLQNLKYANTDV